MAYSLFYMWEPYRKKIIDFHNFYVEQAHERLLFQFSNLEEEANIFYEEWLKKANHLFDPYNDPGYFYSQAYEENITFYEMR